MGIRRSSREAALMMLVALDSTRDPVDDVIRRFWRSGFGDIALGDQPDDPEGRGFADNLVLGVARDQAALDGLIQDASRNWKLSRMTRVDRNLLRLGTWELTRRETPKAVVLDEAVELAKRFGSEDSSSFINGILDRVAEQLDRSGPAGRPEPPAAPGATHAETGAADTETGAADAAETAAPPETPEAKTPPRA